MMKELTKKHIHAGHRASATRMISKAEKQLVTESPDAVKLSQYESGLKEKLEILGQGMYLFHLGEN